MATLSVITLTRNRREKLRRLLDRLLPQLEPGDEILLVDTGSTDGTRETFASPPPAAADAIRLLHYDGPGSWAEMRNFGVAHARGELIAFLDDDCLPDPDWVARGKAGLRDADALGGMVRPLDIFAFPHWWHPEMAWMVGLSVPGQTGPDAGRVHYPFTANLWARAAACRAVAFQELGGQLGGEESARYRTGREDAQWWHSLRTQGYRTRFDPALGVGHAIDPARLDLDYLRRRARLDGQAWAVREGTREDLIPLAYQWWRQFFLTVGALGAGDEERAALWHYHRLTLLRHGQALRGLKNKFFPLASGATRRLLKPWFFKALGSLAWDRGKNCARVLAAPLIRPMPRRLTAVRIERVAVIAFGYLGDLVILQSALRGLMQAHPWLEVYVVAPAGGAHVLRDVRRLNVTPTPDLAPRSRAARDWLADWLERLDPDVIFAPYLHDPWGRVLTSLRHPPRPIFGFDQDQGLRRRIWLERLSVQVHKNLQFHESENLCALFREAGLPCEPAPAALAPAPQALEPVLQDPWLAARQAAATPLLMLNPDAGHRQKEWTAPAWAELLRLILERTGAAVLFNASRPHPELDALAQAAPERVYILKKTPVPELIAWLAQCRALVTVDSGPQHLAHGLGLPSVTLYGPMDERRWVDRWHRTIHRTVRACAWDLTPEEKRGLPVGHEVAMIKPEAVFKELLDIISLKGTKESEV